MTPNPPPETGTLPGLPDLHSHAFQRAMAGLTERRGLVHATHADKGERARVARAKAVVGLCPVTEANLGDGLFDVPDFLAQGGRFGVGSDSMSASPPPTSCAPSSTASA